MVGFRQTPLETTGPVTCTRRGTVSDRKIPGVKLEQIEEGREGEREEIN